MKLTANITGTGLKSNVYALHADGVLIKGQTTTSISFNVGEPTTFTVTLIGKMDKDGVIHICEV